MKVEAHILAYNEAEILPYTLRHYRTFCDRIIIHDGGSTDDTPDIAARFNASMVHFNTQGQLNDALAVILKNGCWSDPRTDSDWVICADADELIYFTLGAEKTLATYEGMGAAVIKPYGFEMFSETYPTTTGQIYDEIKIGARDDKWYGKPILFSPNRIQESGFGVGAHESRPLLKTGKRLKVGQDWLKPDPPTYLLHYHQIGTAQRLASRYNAIMARFSDVNKRHGWGVNEPGDVHVQRKRDYIMPRLERVIA